MSTSSTPQSQHVSFDAFKEEWLHDVRNNAANTVVLGNRFAHKLITQWLDIDGASDDLVYCDGAGDGGIDMAYLHRSGDAGEEGDGTATGDTWFLVQSKYGGAFQGTGTLLEEGQKVVDTLDGQRARLSSLAEGLLERLNTFRRQASDRDKIVLVFATEDPLNDEQKRALGDLRSMGRGRLGPLFDVEHASIENIYTRTLDQILPDTPRVRVSLRAQLQPSGEDLRVGAVSLLALYDFLKEYRDRTEDLDQLYEKNVRRFLGSRGKVNRAMQQTLHNAPERFGLYNNGITLVVESFAPTEDGGLELVDPYIVNGCQTTRTIWEVLHKRLEAGGTGRDPELESWRTRAGQGAVVAKVVKVGTSGEELLEAITRYTNSQNAVKEKDFLALNNNFTGWARQMEERYGVFLEVQRGGWDSRRALQKQNPNLEPHFTEWVNAFDLLKVYGAGWLGEAGTAFGKNPPFLPGGNVFRQIVNGDATDEPFGVEDLYAAYRLEQATNTYGFGRGAPKQSRRQTRFLFYMVVLDVLKDVLVRAGTPAPSGKALSRALLALFRPGNEDAAAALLDTAVEVIDEYLTHGAEDSVYAEPSFQNTFNNDLNQYLKSERVGKSEEASPRLRALLAIHKRSMGRASGGGESPRDQIASAVHPIPAVSPVGP